MKKHVESFDDIVFESRNKEYGAYDLRKKYSKRGLTALAIALFVFFTAVGGPLLASKMKNNPFSIHIKGNQTAELSDLENEVEREVIPPPLPPAPLKQQILLIPNIVDSVMDIAEEVISNADITGTKILVPVDTTSAIVFKETEKNDVQFVEIIFDTYEIEEKPEFPEGDKALLKYVAEHTRYPEPALQNEIEGTVYIRFVVTKTGDVGEAKILRASDQNLANEALRVVKSLPKWKPGKKNGKPVNVWFIMPVKFVLEKK